MAFIKRILNDNLVEVSENYILKSDAAGVAAQSLILEGSDFINLNGGVLISTTSDTTDGMIRYINSTFEFRANGSWVTYSTTGGGGGSVDFLGLTDTVDTYNTAGDTLIINSTNDGVTFSRPRFEYAISYDNTTLAYDLFNANVSITGITGSSTINTWQVATASGFSTPALPFTIDSLADLTWKVFFNGTASTGTLLIEGNDI